MCYSLPKIWAGRIQKYWDKIMPSGFPKSESTFALKFDTPEITSAVTKFENEIGTTESVANKFAPAGTVVSDYVGTYDVKGTPGVLTLLSPEKVDCDNIIALHLPESGEWEVVEDAHVVDGYVWGTLSSFSPIALVTYRKDIHKETLSAPSAGNYIVCEGNTVRIITNNEGKIILKSESTGTEIELTEKTFIIGGSIDGSPIKKTNITVVGVENASIVNKIYAGSYCWNIEDDKESAVVENANVKVYDSKIGCITGSSGTVHTMNLNMILKNVTTSWIGAGESWNTALKRDCNKANCSYASKAWLRTATIELENVQSGLTYVGGNTGYYFVDNTHGIISGGKHDWLVSSGSNGYTNESIIDVSDVEATNFQSVNRGFINKAIINAAGCKVKNVFIGGEDDKSADGTAYSVRYNISAKEDDSYNIRVGYAKAVKLTADDIKEVVDVVKVSRSANVTISDEDIKLLGDKYVIK